MSKESSYTFSTYCLNILTILFFIIVIGAFMGIISGIPLWNKTIEKSVTIKDLSNAKQIYLGMKMYAGDHDGEFPKAIDGRPTTTSNEAFRILVPDYIRDKKVFYSKWSPWTPKPIDGKTICASSPLPGENSFAYVPNLIDADNQHFPLIASGFAKGTPGVYSSANHQAERNSGTFDAVVVRLDGSGKIESGTTDDYRIYDRIDLNEKRDIFKPAPGWLRPDQVPLNPE